MLHAEICLTIILQNTRTLCPCIWKSHYEHWTCIYRLMDKLASYIVHCTCGPHTKMAHVQSLRTVTSSLQSHLPNEYELELELFGKIVLPFTVHLMSCSLYEKLLSHQEYTLGHIQKLSTYYQPQTWGGNQPTAYSGKPNPSKRQLSS